MFREWLLDHHRTSYLESGYKGRIDLVAQSLVRKRYLRAVVIGHLKEWLRFTRHLTRLKLRLPSTVYDRAVSEYIRRRFPSGSDSRFRFIRASVRILIEADEVGDFPRRLRAPQRPTNRLFGSCVPGYLESLRRLRHLKDRTLTKRARHLALFTEFLQEAGVSSLRQIHASHVQEFLIGLRGRHAHTIRGYASTLRTFLRWSLFEGLIGRDLSAAARGVRHYQQARLPDVLTPAEFDALMGTVDRSTAVGRRDDAVLQLAACYGLRPSDIRLLSLDDIEWRAARITLTQSKTGRPLVLPLMPRVARALQEYLRRGRPNTLSRIVFVRHRAPFEPFGPNNNLSTIMREALRRAGLARRPGRRGLYLFRHTLATRMLAQGQPLKTIGDVLGHAHTDSTLFYTKVDLPSLRAAALSIAEVRQ